MRLTCRQWADHLPGPKISAAQRLPAEILSKVYEYLQPIDFDAARHVCKAWFLVGMDIKLASAMLRSCGAYLAFLQDVEQESAKISRNVSAPDRLGSSDIDQEWLASKRLATEAGLSYSWRGSGVHTGRGHSLSNFTVVEQVDFSRLLGPMDENQHELPECRSFTVSACGKYMMLNAGKDIFVYSISNSITSLHPVARLVANRRVLCVSMDTTSGRYSIAALLEGRLGWSWDLRDILSPSSTENQNLGEPMDLGMKTNVQGLTRLGASKPIPMQTLSRRTSDHTDPAQSSAKQNDLVPSLHGVVSYLTESPQSTSPVLCGISPDTPGTQTFSNSVHPLSGPVTIVTRPTSIYRSLGTGGDNPRSVAICPQRKCVAFGCRNGIELHWIDIATGSSLNQWFPLAAPSDHLYFLPRRPGIDTMKKLRLISSAANTLRPSHNRRDSSPARWRFRYPQSHHRGRIQSMTRLFFGSLPFPNALTRSNTKTSLEEDDREGVLRTVDCDHYRAVPISDGAHVLFTDPATGLLCLGSDAPLGGPMKLVRKVCMIPPLCGGPDNAGVLVCYRAGHDLRWGVRTVAAYDDGQVVLYNISADCFDRIRYIRSSPDVWDELAGVLGQSDLLMDVFMTGQPPESANTFETPTAAHESSSRRVSVSSTSSCSFRSLQVDGALIWQAESEVEDIQVDCSNGGCKVWVFMQNARAVQLDIYVPRHFRPTQRYVGTDGLLHELVNTRLKKPGRCSKSKGKARADTAVDDGVRHEGVDWTTTPRSVKFEV